MLLTTTDREEHLSKQNQHHAHQDYQYLNRTERTEQIQKRTAGVAWTDKKFVPWRQLGLGRDC
jgi:hypothetical protein